MPKPPPLSIPTPPSRSRKPPRSVPAIPRSLVLAAAAVALLGVAGCDTKPATAPAPVPGTSAPRQVTVLGEGKVEGTPDTLTASVAIESLATDVTAAMNQASGRQQAVIDALVGSGVDRKDIKTSQVSLQPQYSDNGTAINGYRAANAIDVKIRKIDSASQALALIVTTGGNDTRINSVNYSIDDDSQLVKDARARAFDDAKDRAQQYAQLSGLELGKVLSISETGTGPTPPTPMPRMAVAEAVPLEPGQQTVGFSVTAVWELG